MTQDAPRERTPRRTRLHLESFPGEPVLDTAVSHAMLRRVAGAAVPESLRLYRPDAVLLFSGLDTRRPGFERAVEIAYEHGFGSAIRLAGGHAAAFLRESVAFAWAIPDADARAHIHPRFERLATIVVRALRDLGLDARLGEIANEYCPGEYSVNLEGRVKVMGVGQRVIRGGAHVGGVLTVGQTNALRGVLEPVYAALELEFDPSTAGGVADFDSRLTVESVLEAMRASFEREGARLEETAFDGATLEAAEKLLSMHAPDARAAANRGGSLKSLDGKTLLQTDRAISGRRAPRDAPGNDED